MAESEAKTQKYLDHLAVVRSYCWSTGAREQPSDSVRCPCLASRAQVPLPLAPLFEAETATSVLDALSDLGLVHVSGGMVTIHQLIQRAVRAQVDEENDGVRLAEMVEPLLRVVLTEFTQPDPSVGTDPASPMTNTGQQPGNGLTSKLTWPGSYGLDQGTFTRTRSLSWPRRSWSGWTLRWPSPRAARLACTT